MAADDRAESPEHVQPLAGGAPRPDPGRWFRPATRAELWTGLALITLALLGSGWVLKGRADARALEQDPVRVEGKVVRLWVTRENNGPHCRVEYEYAIPPAGAQVVRDETQLVKGHYDMLREGGPIVVAVCRTDPANHLVIGGRPPALATAETQRVSLGFLGLLGLCGATSVWAWWVSGRKPRPAFQPDGLGSLSPGQRPG